MRLVLESMLRCSPTCRRLALAFVALTASSGHAQTQTQSLPPLRLTIQGAVALALTTSDEVRISQAQVSLADAQVVGVELKGQARCAAFVIPSPDGAPSEPQVLAGAAAIMAGFKVPARVWFLEAFPVTQSANGTKIQRNKLREMAIERTRPPHAA